MSQPLPRFRARQDEAERLRRIARICLDTTEPTPTSRRVTARTAPGDARRLRYIPVIAKGVPGTIPGTNPLSAVVQASEQRPTTFATIHHARKSPVTKALDHLA